MEIRKFESLLFCLLAASFLTSCAKASEDEDIKKDSTLLTFSDEFSGNSLDMNKWMYRGLGILRNDAWYVTDAVTLEDGNLKISVYSTKESDGTYKHYAGMIATQGLFSQKHGYFESKIKFVTKSGEWGAFWLQSPTMGKTGLTDEEAGEEIDIVEHRVSDQKGSDVSNLLIQTIHWGGYGANHKSNSFQRNNTGINVGFHTYGFEWTENAYIMYLDGVETHRWEKNGSVPISQTGEYIILSCEARNASWAGNIPADGYKKGECYMLVDYVRVYSRNPYK